MELPSQTFEYLRAELFPGDGIRGTFVAVEISQDTQRGGTRLGSRGDGDIDAETLVPPMDDRAGLGLIMDDLSQCGCHRRRILRWADGAGGGRNGHTGNRRLRSS